MKNYSRKIGNRKGLATFRTPSTYRIRKHIAIVGAKSKHATHGSKKFQTSTSFHHPPTTITEAEPTAGMKKQQENQPSSATDNDTE